MTDFGKIETYYSQFDEWGRLDTAQGRLEFQRAMTLLDRHLKRPSRVLDLGGGPGRYAIALAERGHQVVLADLSPPLLEIASDKIREAGVEDRVEAIVRANATDLCQWPDASFDAVVTLGPFYHLTLDHERAQAAAEISRVLKADGLAVVAFIPYLTGIAGLVARAAVMPGQVSADSFGDAVTTGIFHNLSNRGFQEGYYPASESIVELLRLVGLVEVETVSLRGIANMLETHLETIGRQDPSLHARILAAIDATASHPAAVALCGHAVCIARKQAAYYNQGSQ